MINNKIKITEVNVKLKRKEKVEKHCKAQTGVRDYDPAVHLKIKRRRRIL